jgi:hypothetical protein
MIIKLGLTNQFALLISLFIYCLIIIIKKKYYEEGGHGHYPWLFFTSILPSENLLMYSQ